MEKIDITIGSKMTINTQNYSSIQPNVSLTIKDVELDKVIETKIHLNNILSIFMAEQIVELSDTMETIKINGLKEIISKYENPELIEKMKISLQNSIDAIK